MSKQWTKVFKDGKWKSVKLEGSTNYLITLGPLLAQKWLDNRNHHNRKQKVAQIGKIAREIVKGRWTDTANYISFYRDGVLHDGQNRLAAIVKSGRAVRARIVFGIDPMANMVTDSGVKRSLHDRATLAGHVCESKSLKAARFIIESVKRSKKIWDDEIVAFHDQHKETIDRVCETIKHRPVSKQPAHAAISLVGIQRPDKVEKVVEFAEKFSSGLGISSPNNPALRLRNFAVDNSRSNSGAWRTELFLKTLFACRAFVDGKQIPRLFAAKADTVLVEDFALEV